MNSPFSFSIDFSDQIVNLPGTAPGASNSAFNEFTGTVSKIVDFGAFVRISPYAEGLVHISEFETPEKLKETLELGKTYPFTITLFEPKDQRLTLSYKKSD